MGKGSKHNAIQNVNVLLSFDFLNPIGIGRGDILRSEVVK